jgi:hypothetical protein
LFAVPIAVLGQATGQASLPFFARLFNEKKLKEFATTVNDSVYRVSGGVVAGYRLDDGCRASADRSGLPPGKVFCSPTRRPARVYFFWFSLSLVLWSAQGLYARAFYAAGDTLTPMLAVSVITLASLPIYSILFHTFGVVGLAWASDIGIGLNLLALAGLLHYKKLVPLGELRWGELGKAARGCRQSQEAISFEVAKAVPLTGAGPWQPSGRCDPTGAGVITWLAAVAAGLWLLRSELPGDLRRRKGAVYPCGRAERKSKENLGSRDAAVELRIRSFSWAILLHQQTGATDAQCAAKPVPIQTLVEGLRQLPESALDRPSRFAAFCRTRRLAPTRSRPISTGTGSTTPAISSTVPRSMN